MIHKAMMELPLEGNSIKECFKVYTTDIGILMEKYGYGP